MHVQHIERQHVQALAQSLDGLKREMRTSFEASQHQHNRLRELVEERRADAVRAEAPPAVLRGSNHGCHTAQLGRGRATPSRDSQS